MRKKRAYDPDKPKPEKQALTEAEAWPKLLRYCAFQERAPAEVERKMKAFGLDPDTRERLLARLKEENYLSVNRFAETYAGGKLRTNRWGGRKIAMGLAAKGIDKETIQEKVAGLPEEEVRATIRTLLEKRDASQYRHLPMTERRQKLWRLGLSRGFAGDLISAEVKRLTGGTIEEEDNM